MKPIQKNENNRLEWIDELRGVAALAVLVSHYRIIVSTQYQLVSLDILGHGVQLFYILSGFILAKLYRDKIHSKGQYRSFLVRRFFRIAPMYYVATLFSFTLFYKDIFKPIYNILTHLFIFPTAFNPKYINGIIGVEWSVLDECCFYLIFPALVCLSRSNKIKLFGCSIIISLLQTILPRLRILIFNNQFDVSAMRAFIYFLPTTQLCFFITGILIAEANWQTKPMIYLRKKAFIVMCAILIVLFLLPVAAKSFNLRLYGAGLFLAGMIVIYDSVRKPRWISKALLWVGQRSYSIYLLHLPLLTLYMNYNDRRLIVAIPLCIGLFVLSSLTYKYVELVGIEFGRWFESRICMSAQRLKAQFL
jgi:peptidoglycan/LPS O-acetylase OafA/YrhL